VCRNHTRDIGHLLFTQFALGLVVRMFAPHETAEAERSTTTPHVAVLPWTILVVDADAATRALYRQSFVLAGCDVVEASDGREALTRALVRPPALLVTEIDCRFWMVIRCAKFCAATERLRTCLFSSSLQKLVPSKSNRP
jgi:PleD family two-component response regulator